MTMDYFGSSYEIPFWNGVYYPPFDSDYPQEDIEDPEIKHRVEDALCDDPALTRRDKQSIDVAVSAGVVTLSGEVRNRFSKYHAFRDAFFQQGVLDVHNNLTIKHLLNK